MRMCGATAGVLLVAGVLAAESFASEGTISIRSAEILVPADQPRYVSRAVEDLQRIVSQLPSDANWSEAGQPSATIELAVSDQLSETVEAFTIEAPPPVQGRPNRIRITGADSAGLKFGIIELTTLLQVTAGDVVVPAPLHIRREPLLATRGMYAHLHWAYRHPYALRSWNITDWKRYIDLLTHLGFNTIQIWPMMELLPHPLSTADREYLQVFAAIVEYAHRERGMKVFIGSCPNSITEDARGVPIADREYHDFEKRINPGEADGLRTILEARSDLYRTVSNADGYWVIDSDPGGWKGSPSGDFVSILAGHRQLIDTHGRRPAEQPLIYWMWYSWGPDTREDNWRATLTEAKQRLEEPWRLHLCLPEHLQLCRELDLLDRATYFPYNLLETEPSGPLTELRFEGIDAAVGEAIEARLGAILGNAQTPLVQLPNIARLSDSAWQDSRGKQEPTTLQRLARRLVLDQPELLERAWQSLEGDDPAEISRLAGELRSLVQDDNKRGPLRTIIGDWQERVVEDLTLLLEIRAGAVGFARAVQHGAGREEQAERLDAYMNVLLNWLERTGYHNDRIVAHRAYKEPVSRALETLRHEIGPQALQAEILGGPWAEPVDRARNRTLVIETLLGQRK